MLRILIFHMMRITGKAILVDLLVKLRKVNSVVKFPEPLCFQLTLLQSPVGAHE